MENALYIVIDRTKRENQKVVLTTKDENKAHEKAKEIKWIGSAYVITIIMDDYFIPEKLAGCLY